MFYKLKILILYLITFFIIFLPNLRAVTILPGNLLLILIIAILNIVVFNKEIILFMFKTKIIIFVFVQICLISYLLIVQLISGTYNIDSISPNLFLVIQVINISGIYLSLNKLSKGNQNKQIDFIINLGLIQGIIMLLMMFIPSLKQLAIDMYQQDNFDWFYNNRIFGIAGDFTYMLPITMSFIGIISYLYYRKNTKIRYLIYSLFIVGISSFNGRTGLMIYIFSILIIAGLDIKKLNLKLLLQSLPLMGFACLFLWLMYFNSAWVASRMNWVFDSFIQTYRFIFFDEAQEHFGQLGSNMIFFPENINFVFGQGTRVFGELGLKYIGKQSDIGYINDLFKGGIVYLIPFYISIIWLVRSKNKKINHRYNFLIIIYLIISNYKGEALTGSPLIITMLMIKFIIDKTNGGDVQDAKNISTNERL